MLNNIQFVDIYVCGLTKINIDRKGFIKFISLVKIS